MSRQFSGGDITAIFGNAALDLREADLAPGAEISVTAVFGSIELHVPENWDVRLAGTPILGTFKDQRKRQANMSTDRTLIVDGTCAFGSVEVK